MFITSIELVIILLALITAAAAAAFSITHRLSSLPGFLPLCLFLLTIFTWILMSLLYTAEPHFDTALLFYKFSLAAKSYAFVFLMLFAYCFTKPHACGKSAVWIAALIVPTATGFFLARYPEIFFQNIEIVLFYHFKQLLIMRGVWFYVDVLYNYSCLLLSVIFFINHYKISVGIVSVFNKISSILIILKENGDILTMNEKGRQKFSFILREDKHMPYHTLIDTWLRERGGTIREDSGLSMVCVEEETRKYYELLKSAITDSEGTITGSFIELRDITVQQELIAKLFHMVNFDQLTDLYNRRYFEDRCEQLNKAEFLPLTFIAGDLNNLKYVNDTYGHAYGDKLIKAAALSLSRFTPQKGSACRTGGDEFVVIIPNFTEEEAISFIDKLSVYTSSFTEKPYGGIDISLGHAVRKNMSDTIGQVLKEADMVMYKDKEKKKVSFRQNARPYNK